MKVILYSNNTFTMEPYGGLVVEREFSLPWKGFRDLLRGIAGTVGELAYRNYQIDGVEYHGHIQIPGVRESKSDWLYRMEFYLSGGGR